MQQLTIKDIARLAGVSYGTVSRALNSHPNVRPEVRERILQVVDEYHYTPQAAARNLAKQRTGIIGVLFPRSPHYLLTNPIFAAIAQGIGQACIERGYIAMLSLGLAAMDEQLLASLLQSRQFDGIVLMSSEMNDPMPLMLQKMHIPYTRIGHDPGANDSCTVDIDNVEAATLAVSHLIALGHRRIAFINGPEGELCTRDRYSGYQKALAAAGLSVDEELVCVGDWSHTSGDEAMERFLALDQAPSAVFSANDMMAAGALHTLHRRGLSVPGDVAVVGFDDLPQTGVIIPALTTISQPSAELGIHATEMVIDQLENKTCEPTHMVLSTTLVIRQSCGALIR